MGRPYTMDLRTRVVAAMRAGMSGYEAAERFAVSEPSARRWAKRDRETGNPAALPMGGRRPFALAQERERVLARVTAKPDITLRELLAELQEQGFEVSYYAVWHILKRSRVSFKKNSARQ